MNLDFNNWFDSEQYCLEGFEIIDLSEEIEEYSEVPGEKGYSDPDVVFEKIEAKRTETAPWVTLDIKPYYISKIVMGAHVGTHVDAPMHAAENGRTIDKIPREFIGPIVIVEANEKLTSQKLSNELDKLHSDSILVVRGKSNYKMPEEFRKAIIRSKPSIVAFGDCVNVDGVEDTIQYCQNDIPMVMGLNQPNMEKLDNGDIMFILPIKFRNIEAAPARVFCAKLKLASKQTSYNSSVYDMEDL